MPGGCSYNTMRVFNWLLQNKDKSDITGVLGSVGADFYGDLYASLLERENVVPIFEKFENINTGICCVFCHNRDRGHITDLGASVLVSHDFVKRMWSDLEETVLIFTELFILKHKPDIVFLLAEHSLENNKIFGFNLPSFYFLETYIELISVLVEYCDVLFANAAEAKFLAAQMGIQYEEDDLGALCKKFASNKKRNVKRKRVVVITAGPDAAYVAEYDPVEDKLTYFASFEPNYVDETEIVDTNGAGDAFAGGFLSKFMKDGRLDECMAVGHWAASVLIKQRGFQIPEGETYKGC